MILFSNNNITKIFFSLGLLSFIIAICIYFPYYNINYKNSQINKENLYDSICNVINQTYVYKYSCTKKFYQCNCQTNYYYPCEILLNKYIQNYCCDPVCYKNTSTNSLNYIICGYDTIITSIIENDKNITNVFIDTCKFDDNQCINYWTNLKENKFICYYESTDKNTILLDKPNFIELYSIGFIFAYIFFGFTIIFMIFGIYYYIKYNNYMKLN